MNYMEEQWREKGRPAQSRAKSGRELEGEGRVISFLHSGAKEPPNVPDGPTASNCMGLRERGVLPGCSRYNVFIVDSKNIWL